jgi:hypothetical protein
MAPLGQIVEGTLRDILGWRPRTEDSKGFVAALTQSFKCTEEAGKTVCVYTPRTLAVQVQADMGAVTGAQASLYARANSAINQSLIILDRLKPLDPVADPQNVQASRATVELTIKELLYELGLYGGPRTSRVDSLFDLLCGDEGSPTNPEQIKGQLGVLRDEFGFEHDWANSSIEKEQNFTDFITLVDYVNSLKQSWKSQRQFFDRSNTVQPFLGTQLVLISRALEAVVESVQEFYSAADSVFLGAEDLQIIQLTFGNSYPPMYVSELLGWVERFASQEGTQLVMNAGKFGLRAFFPTIDRLIDLVEGSRISPQDSRALPEGYKTARVQRALQEIATHLKETASLARSFLPEKVASIPAAMP